MSRTLRYCALLLGLAACRDVGLVGEGSACAEACSSGEACIAGECEPIGGTAGDGFDRDDHDNGGHDGDDHDGQRPPPDDDEPWPHP